MRGDEIDLNEAILNEYEDGTIEYRMDTIWYLLQDMRSVVGNFKRFGLLFQVARFILITLHSNAGIERVYSLVNKNKKEGSERNRLDIDGTLSSILAAKLAISDTKDNPCYKFKPDDKLIGAAKKATKAYNDRPFCKRSNSTIVRGCKFIYFV